MTWHGKQDAHICNSISFKCLFINISSWKCPCKDPKDFFCITFPYLCWSATTTSLDPNFSAPILFRQCTLSGSHSKVKIFHGLSSNYTTFQDIRRFPLCPFDPAKLESSNAVTVRDSRVISWHTLSSDDFRVGWTQLHFAKKSFL